MVFTPSYLSKIQKVLSFDQRVVFGPAEDACCQSRGLEPRFRAGLPLPITAVSG